MPMSGTLGSAVRTSGLAVGEMAGTMIKALQEFDV
jgi:hypothetical protein